MNNHHIFGIRHHGPGSALALRQALEELDPDILLVEGPPDGNAILHWLNHPQMILPTAVLIYRPDRPQSAAYYPYTKFSPETQAIRFALERNRPVRFADLPQKYLMAAQTRPSLPGQELFQTLAEATGYRSYEEWWNLAIEQRRDSTAVFEAVMELMAALRQESPPEENQEADGLLWAARREASMRQAIREAIAEGYRRVAFVCGAWHAPALRNLSTIQEDRELLNDLPEVEVEATWVPWTYGRLAMHSGYGAGILSPGWYDHLWTRGLADDSVRDTAAGWLAQVSALLRDQGFSASPANVIEALRLAEALAALRGLPFPGLPELNEAVIAVLCGGDQTQMDLIRRKLIVGERMGMVPPDTPMVPLACDLLRLQKELELFPEPEPLPLKLDLRQEVDLARSHLLHRLRLLGIPWGEPGRMRGQTNMAIENWTLQWQPDFPVRIIEASLWGNTVAEAATAWVDDAADRTRKLVELTGLLDRVILADLPQAVAAIVARIEDESAVSSDIPHMMAALPPLARVLRYGSARQIDQQTLQKIVDSLLTRICIGLPSTCAAMDDEPAQKMADQLSSVTAVVHTLRDPEQASQWHDALLATLKQSSLHGILDGRISRILLDDDALTAEAAARRMEGALRRSSSAALSPDQAAQSAAWLDGFLAGSELLLIHDRRLWALLDGFINELPADRFLQILPLLRRVFSGYSEAARRQLQEQAQAVQDSPLREMPVYAGFDHERAEAVLPLIKEILGE
ncbi:MAG: DUF5682 family protein [Candidatus Promineifilaceae bacterium]|jgi:hypothetical protein